MLAHPQVPLLKTWSPIKLGKGQNYENVTQFVINQNYLFSQLKQNWSQVLCTQQMWSRGCRDTCRMKRQEVEVRMGAGGGRGLKCIIIIPSEHVVWCGRVTSCVKMLLELCFWGGVGGGHKVHVWVMLRLKFRVSDLSYGRCHQQWGCCNSGREAAWRGPASRPHTQTQRSTGRVGRWPWPRTSSLQWSAETLQIWRLVMWLWQNIKWNTIEGKGQYASVSSSYLITESNPITSNNQSWSYKI